MATYYVSSVDGNDGDSGLTWALAKATVAGALAVATTTGDLILVDSAHAETLGAAITWNAATSGIYVAIISVNRNGSTTTGHSGWLKGATVTITASGFGIAVASTGAQSLYIYGIIFAGNNGASAGNNFTICSTAEATVRNVTLDNCEISTPGTSGSSLIALGSGTGSAMTISNITLKDTLLKGHNSTSNAILLARNAFIFASGLTIGYNTAKPANFCEFSTGVTAQIEILDSDLSGYENSSGNLFIITALRHGYVSLQNCKLSSNPTKAPTGTWQNNNVFVQYINVSSADTKTVFEYYNRLGTITANTSIYANASVQMNSTSLSWEIVTTAACNEQEVFITPWLMTWGDSTASQNAGFRLIHDSLTNLHNRNCWAIIDYVSDASFPKGTLGSTRNATPFDGSSADLSSDSETWTGTGGFANPNKQKVDHNFTPAEKALLRGKLNIGIASKTLYLVPQLWLS